MTKEEKAEYAAAYYKRNKIQIAAKKRAYYVANEEKLRAKDRAYYVANAEKIRESKRAYREANREKLRAKQAVRRRNNPEAMAAYRAANSEKIRTSNAAYKRRNPHKCVAYSHKRRAVKLRATPNWATVTVDQHVEQLALQRTPDQHIDHIVPLLGKLYSNHPIQLVCGLHAEDNLRLISTAENLAKNCREWPDMWCYTTAHMAELELLWQAIQPNTPIASSMKPYV